MSESDLDRLLAGEIERRVHLLSGAEVDVREARAALHSLRGSASMAGRADLALVIAHLSSRLRAGDLTAPAEAASLLASVLGRLKEGKPPFESHWPEPPPGLGASRIDPTYRVEYLTLVRDRLAEIESALDPELPPERAVERATRAVHAIKGAAGAVGDDATAWYCHELETLLKSLAGSKKRIAALFEELPRHKSVLALLVEDQAAALDALRRTPSVRPSSPPASSRRPGGDDESSEHTVRVQGAWLERVLERLERIQLVNDEVAAAAASSHALSDRLRTLRADLQDSLRLLGPPRPWGPPAAALARIEAAARRLGSAAEDAENESLRCRRGALVLGASAGDIRREIGQVRRTTMSELLTRVAIGIERIATREGRHVRVQVSSSDVPVDREIAARLADPLMQLARNALAHGIEAPEERARRGKPPVGVIQLGAERHGDLLCVSCEDDGRGVEIESIRRVAVERGSVSAEAARTARDDELLALLFVPGFTTQAEADLLAGRGVGLDLSLALVRRLGGTIRLESRAGTGLRALIEVPSERWLVDVLWVSASGWELALPVSFTGKLSRVDPDKPPIHLASCLGLPVRASPSLSLELALSGIPTVSIGVDAVGDVEECNIRPLPALAAAAGPFSGAIVRGDGALNLALDPALLAVRAWALA